MTYVTDEKRLSNMVELYDYFAAHPGAGMSGLAAVLELGKTTVRYRIDQALHSGILRRAHSDVFGDKYIYYVVGERPVEVPLAKYSRRGNPGHSNLDTRVRRVFVKAEQMDIPRDPLIAAIFGPAVRA